MNVELLGDMCDRLLKDWLAKLAGLRNGTKYALYVLALLPFDYYCPEVLSFRWLESPDLWKKIYSDQPVKNAPQPIAYADNPEDLMPANTAVLARYFAVVCKAKTPFKYVPVQCYRGVEYRGKRLIYNFDEQSVGRLSSKLGVSTLESKCHVPMDAYHPMVNCVRECKAALLYSDEELSEINVVVKASNMRPFKE